MTNAPPAGQSLLAVTNWQSRALLPFEIYEPEFTEWAHKSGAYLYMILVGPRSEIVSLSRAAGYWSMRTRYYDGHDMKPRKICVPFEILPELGTTLVGGVVNYLDKTGTSRVVNATQVVRSLLQAKWRPNITFDSWHSNTLRKFFTYRVEYIGQAFGKVGERTAAERLKEGHETLQKVLSETMAYHPNVEVAVMVMDAHVERREASFTLTTHNIEQMAKLATRVISEPEGPLVEPAKLVTVAEAMLIRAFPRARNIQYKNFPNKDAPALVNELITAGISHLGIQLDISLSMALLEHPDEGEPPSHLLRFGVNLATGDRETPTTSAHLSWKE
jgi:hypothetical protein